MSSIWARTVIWLCFVLLLDARYSMWKPVESEDSVVELSIKMSLKVKKVM